MNLAQQRQNLGKMSLDELADWMAGISMNSPNDQIVRAEFLRRQTEAAQESAEAATETADYTRNSARYMFWSVVVLAASSIATLIVTIAK
jgi:hypothetical protein